MLKKALATVVVNPEARGAAGRRPASTAVVRASSVSHRHGASRPAAAHVSSGHAVVRRQLRGGRAGALAGAAARSSPSSASSSSARRAAVTVVPHALFGSNKAQAHTTPEPAEVSVPIDELTETCRRGIKTYGYDDAETQILLDVMMYAQLRGNNQGIIKVTTKGIARDPGAGPIATEHETMLSACFNGNKNAGMVVLHKAMETAVTKAKAHGFGICGGGGAPRTRNHCSLFAPHTCVLNLE